ncbi:MAG: hypothetical protein ACI9WU_000444 [Myxococcota bacterium]|jgi:hypothetical protein
MLSSMGTDPNSSPELSFPQPPAWLLRWWWVPVPILCALAWRDSSGFGLLSDARFLIQDNRFFDDPGLLWESLTTNYFHSASGNQIPYWRPFTKVSWHLESLVFGRASGAPFHLIQVAWHLLATYGVIFTARQLGLDRRWSTAAGFLYALHPAMVEPTCLVMARSDITATAGVVWSLGAFLAWDRTGARRWAVLHLVAGVVALGSKEVAIILAPLTLMLALTSEQRGKALTRALPLVALTAVYWVTRGAILTGSAPEMAFHRRRFGISAGLYFQGLLPFRLDSGVRSLGLLEAVDTSTRRVVGLGWSVMIGAGIYGLVKRQWRLLVLLCWVGGSLLPVLLAAELNVPGVEDKFPLADRWMAQAVAASSIGFVWLASRVPHPQVAPAVQVMVVAWAAVAIAKAPESHGFYADEDSLVALEEKHYQEIPEEWRTREDTCRATDRAIVGLLGAGKWVDAERETSSTIHQCGFDASRGLNHTLALTELERWPEAAAVGDRVAKSSGADTRHVPRALYLSGQAYIRMQKPRPGLHRLHRAKQLGEQSCNLHIQMAAGAEMTQDPSGVARGLEAGYRCGLAQGSQPNPQMLLAAAHWYRQVGQGARAKVLLNEASGLNLPPQLRRQLDAMPR